MKLRVPKIGIKKGPNSHRDCDGKLDEAAQAELGAKAKALAPHRAELLQTTLERQNLFKGQLLSARQSRSLHLDEKCSGSHNHPNGVLLALCCILTTLSWPQGVDTGSVWALEMPFTSNFKRRRVAKRV